MPRHWSSIVLSVPGRLRLDDSTSGIGGPNKADGLPDVGGPRLIG